MKHEFPSDTCNDQTMEFNIKIPCPLAVRIEAFAKENKTAITSVIIEALDSFLRMQKTPSP